MNITPAQFIDAAYEVDAGETVCVCRPGKKGFIQYAWNEQTANMIETQPDEWYVCVSTVTIPIAGDSVRRRKKDCKAVWVLMLDDIGTKAAAPAIHPSAVLETSEGNYQYLYFLHGIELNKPEDIARFEAQNAAIIAAGYGDPGAQGVSRVYRLPRSINRKPGKNNWQTRVVWWEPDTIFNLDELLGDLNVHVDYNLASETEVPILPEDVEDPVLDWLNASHLCGDATEEWYSVVCPWAHTHTTQDAAAGYSPLGHGDKPHLRGFHCFHGHCAGRTITDFLSWVQQQGGPAVSIVGTRELDALSLTSVVHRLSTQERIELIRNSLPELRKNLLPDVKLSEKGTPLMGQLPTRSNVEYVATQYGIRLRRNLASHEVVAEFTDMEMQRLVQTPEEVMRVLFDGCLRIGINSEKAVGDIACEMSCADDYHPMEDWIKAQKWDGKSRVGILEHTIQVEHEYVGLWRTYLRRWLIQTVQAVCGWRYPKQIGSVLVFVGEQYIGKTRWFNSIVPQEFFLSGQNLHLTGHGQVDTIMRATGRPVVELGELDATFRQSDIAALKGFLTQTEDRYRVPYGRKPLDWPRTVSFCASVNKVDFLVDSTGNRRYWPVVVKACHPEHDLDLGQLWAEIYALWKKGEQWWLTVEENQARQDGSSFFYAISDVEQDTIQWFEAHTDEVVEPMNLTMFCKHLVYPSTRANLSSIRRLLSLRLGPPRAQIKNVRNAWNIPVKPKQHIEAVAGTRERKAK